MKDLLHIRYYEKLLEQANNELVQKAKVSEHGRKLYSQQIRDHILSPLHERYGIDISDESIRRAVLEHNEMCALFEEISNFRKSENPIITPREFHILCLVSYACPSSLILPYLRETLEDLRQRRPNAVSPWRARIVVVGGELDDYVFSEILENCRCYVAADRYCFGSFPGRQQIPLTDSTPALDQVCDFYLESNQCPRFMSQDKIIQRRETVKDFRVINDPASDVPYVHTFAHQSAYTGTLHHPDRILRTPGRCMPSAFI